MCYVLHGTGAVSSIHTVLVKTALRLVLGVALPAGAKSGLCSMKRLGILLLPPWMGCQSIARLSPAPSIMITSTTLYTWLKRDNVA